MTSPTGRAKAASSACRRRTGLTLIEVLISVVILSTGAVLVMHAFAKAWETVRVAEHRAAADVFALSKMADLELANQQGLDLMKHPSGAFRADGHPFSWHVSVEGPDAEHPDRSSLVTLTVTWPRGGDTDQLQCHTLLRPPVVPAAQ